MSSKTYVIDIDGTIVKTKGMDYENSVPITERISKINELYDQGNTIIYLTARGMGRNGNSYELARNQFFDLRLIHHQMQILDQRKEKTKMSLLENLLMKNHTHCYV